MYNDIQTLRQIIRIINALHLEHTVILIGSWAEYFYQNLFSQYYSSFRTTDTDFLIKRPVSGGKGFVKAMQEAGFTYDEDPYSGKSRFFKNGIEVEFLTNLTRNYAAIYRIRDLDINAECLKYMNIVIANTISYQFSDGDIVLIPDPSAYIIQKALINNDRKPDKAKKDVSAIRGLLLAITEEKRYDKEFLRIFNGLSRKEKRLVEAFAIENEIIEMTGLILKAGHQDVL